MADAKNRQWKKCPKIEKVSFYPQFFCVEYQAKHALKLKGIPGGGALWSGP